MNQIHIVQDLTLSVSPQETTLLAEVLKVINSVREEAGEEKCNSGYLKRSVMTQLRAAGYDAALCKSRWDHAGGLPGGAYLSLSLRFQRQPSSTVQTPIQLSYQELYLNIMFNV